jgi:hypothetical protein
VRIRSEINIGLSFACSGRDAPRTWLGCQPCLVSPVLPKSWLPRSNVQFLGIADSSPAQTIDLHLSGQSPVCTSIAQSQAQAHLILCLVVSLWLAFLSVVANMAAELWRHPDPKSTPMYKFMQHINTTFGLALDDYPALYKWSVDHVPSFWEQVWHFVGVEASQPFDEVGSRRPCLIPPFAQSCCQQCSEFNPLSPLLPLLPLAPSFQPPFAFVFCTAAARPCPKQKTFVSKTGAQHD